MRMVLSDVVWREVLMETPRTRRMLQHLGGDAGPREWQVVAATIVDIVTKLEDLGALGDRSPVEVAYNAAGMVERVWESPEELGKVTRGDVAVLVETAKVLTPDAGWVREEDGLWTGDSGGVGRAVAWAKKARAFGLGPGGS